MEKYTIGTRLGYEMAMGLQPGQSVTATDGSVWTKNQDGTIGVKKGGSDLIAEITYQPQKEPSRQDTIAGMGGGAPSFENPYQGKLDQALQGMEQAPNYESPYRAWLDKILQGMDGQKYESPYKDKLDSVISGIEGSQYEGYDPDKDPVLQSIQAQGLRDADRTMEDTLGRYAQNTGGIAGSSAITAASQAADLEKSKIRAVIPQLAQNDFQRYLQLLAQQKDLAGILMNADRLAEGQFRGDMAMQGDLAGMIMNADRLAEGQFRGDQAQKNAFLQALMQASQQAESQHYNRIQAAMQKWAQLGVADQEIAGILGVAPGTETSDAAYTKWKQAMEEQAYADKMALAAQKAAGKGNVGGPGTNPNPKGGDKTDDPKVLAALRERLRSGAGMSRPAQASLILSALNSGSITEKGAKDLMSEMGLK